MKSFVSGSDYRVRKALQSLDREPNQALSGLAHQLRLSRSRLSHLFKAETGFSIKSYVFSCRLQKAGHLLLTTKMAIKEIAYSLGYRHGPSFVRAFKAQFGAPPSRYRKAGGSSADPDESDYLVFAPDARIAGNLSRVCSESISAGRAVRVPALKRPLAS